MQTKIFFITFYFLIANVLLIEKDHKHSELMTCAERNSYSDAFEYSFGSWNMGNPFASSYISFLEALAGEYINFFILNRYGMSEPIENTNAALYDKGQEFYPYTSICELARYSYIPYEKIVIDECSSESCGSPFDNASHDTLRQMISEAANANNLGGISVGNYNAESSSDSLLDFSKVILENRNKSAFFETSTSVAKKQSKDVPRFILNVQDFPGDYGYGLEDFYKKIQSHGVNYTVIDGYNAETDQVGDNLKWYKSNCVKENGNVCVPGGYTKVLAKVTNITDVVLKINYEESDAYYEANKIEQVIRDYGLDGVILDFQEIDDKFGNPNTLCATAFIIRKISENVKPNIVAVKTDIKNMVPFVENKVWTSELKTEVWNFMRDSYNGYNRCYSEKVNPKGLEWENTVKQNNVFTEKQYDKPENDAYLPENFFEVYNAFGASRTTPAV